MKRLIATGVAPVAALALLITLAPTGPSPRAQAQLPLPTPTPTLDTGIVDDTVDDLLPGDDPDLEISPEEIVNGGDDASSGTTGGDGGDGASRGGRDRGGDRTDTTPSRSEGATEHRFEGPTPAGGFFVGGGPAPMGAFDTDYLVKVASRLKDGGMTDRAVVRRVFTPFIIGGRAAWSNTWGAPRFGPAPGEVRTHQGQDVFCDFGAPVLATVPGRVSFGDGGIGGKVARVHTRDGGYWYYAHLSGWNQEAFAVGDRVKPGDLLGWCGNTGNATRTAPHVHFGHYRGDGAPANPMRPLVKWLRTAVRSTKQDTVASRVRTRPDATTGSSEAMLRRLHDLPELAGKREGEG